MKIYKTMWHEIAKKDWPKYNEVFLCKDSQQRLGENTWFVGIMGPSNKIEDDLMGFGLFWHREWALEFAAALINTRCTCEGKIRWGNPECEIHMHV